MKFTLRRLTKFPKAILSAVIALLLLVNLLMVTSAQFFDWVSSGFAALPLPHLMAKSPQQRQQKLREDNRRLRGQSAHMRQAIQSSSARLQKRLTRSMARNAAASSLELLPLLGGGVAVASMAMDVWDACALLAEVRTLEAAVLGDSSGTPVPTLCGFGWDALPLNMGDE